MPFLSGVGPDRRGQVDSKASLQGAVSEARADRVGGLLGTLSWHNYEVPFFSRAGGRGVVQDAVSGMSGITTQ